MHIGYHATVNAVDPEFVHKAFRGGQHLAFAPLVDDDIKKGEQGNGSADFGKRRGEFQQTPLANTFVSIANAMGVPTKSFADSTGPLDGLV